MSPFDGAHMTSYYRSIAITGLSRTVSEIDGDFSQKSQNFPMHPLYFTPPLKRFSLELGIVSGVKKTRT